MSVVTGIMLITSVCDDEAISLVHGWFDENMPHLRLKDVSDETGGNKHPQYCAWGAGINHFSEDDEDEFARFVMGLDWHLPENVILILQPEEGVTRVLRPKPYCFEDPDLAHARLA